MPFNVQGLFQRLYSWMQERDRGEKIYAEKMDKEFDNITSAINAILSGHVKIRGQMQAEGGTEENPGYGFYTDEDTGIYRMSPDHLGFATKGIEALKIDAAQKTYFKQNAEFAQQMKAREINLDTYDNKENSKGALYLAESTSRNYHKIFLQNWWTVFQSHKDQGWKFQNDSARNVFTLHANGSIDILGDYTFIDFKKETDKDYDYRMLASSPNGISFTASAGNEMNLWLNAPQDKTNYLFFQANGKSRWSLGRESNQSFYLHGYHADGSYRHNIFQIDYQTGITRYHRPIHVETQDVGIYMVKQNNSNQGKMLKLDTIGNGAQEGPQIHFRKDKAGEWGVGMKHGTFEGGNFAFFWGGSEGVLGQQSVMFTPDGHIWTYSMGWLREYCVRDVRLSGRNIQKKIWNTWYTVGTIPYTGSPGSGGDGWNPQDGQRP